MDFMALELEVSWCGVGSCCGYLLTPVCHIVVGLEGVFDMALLI